MITIKWRFASIASLTALLCFAGTQAWADDKDLCGVNKSWADASAGIGLETSPSTHPAVQACTKLIDADPRNVMALVRRGQLLFEMSHGDKDASGYTFADAKKDLNTALKIDPNHAEALEVLDYIVTFFEGQRFRIVLGDGKTEKGFKTAQGCERPVLSPIAGTKPDLSDELSACNRLIEFSTTWKHKPDVLAHILSQRSELLWLNGDRELAIADLTRAIELVPNIGEHSGTSPYHVQRGFSYGRLKRYDLAIADYSTVLKQEPLFKAQYYQSRGELFAQAGHHDAAVADYTAAIAAQATEQTRDKQEIVADGTHYLLRGIAYASLNDKARARADFEQALKLRDENAHFNFHELFLGEKSDPKRHATSHEIAKAQLAKLR